MTNLTMWAAIVGFFLPAALAIVMQQHWTQTLRSIVAFLACAAASVGTVLLQGSQDFTWHRWVTAALTTLTVTLATYKGFWHPTGAAPAIEKKTSGPADGNG